MNTKTKFINYYKEGYMPWVHSQADFNLVTMVEKWPLPPCRTLEVGCGTGTDAIWLAEKGFEVTAVDVSDIAIEVAKKTKSNVNFLIADVLKDNMPGNPFDFVFDRGYLHSYHTDKKRRQLAKVIADNLTENGMWLTLAGSCDSPPRETGPPMLSAKNITDAVESFFEIKALNSSVFGSESKVPANIWVCLMKKR